MIPLLSAALLSTATTGDDIILSAYIGAMDPAEQLDYHANGPSGYPGRFAHCVLGTYPQLGASVRCWPRLADELEQKGRIPRVKPGQAKYRREIHVSLWKVLVSLQEQGWAKSRIGELLMRHGL